MQNIQEKQQELATQKQLLAQAKQKLMKVKSLSGKIDKAFEMMETIKEGMNEFDVEREIEKLDTELS